MNAFKVKIDHAFRDRSDRDSMEIAHKSSLEGVTHRLQIRLRQKTGMTCQSPLAFAPFAFLTKSERSPYREPGLKEAWSGTFDLQTMARQGSGQRGRSARSCSLLRCSTACRRGLAAPELDPTAAHRCSCRYRRSGLAASDRIDSRNER